MAQRLGKMGIVIVIGLLSGCNWPPYGFRNAPPSLKIEADWGPKDNTDECIIDKIQDAVACAENSISLYTKRKVCLKN